MKPCHCLCAYLECNSINIYISEKRFEQKLQTKIKHIVAYYNTIDNIYCDAYVHC
jgi:hypothetical protein